MKRRSLDDNAVGTSNDFERYGRINERLESTRSKSAPRERRPPGRGPATLRPTLRPLPVRPTAGRQVSLGSWDAYDNHILDTQVVPPEIDNDVGYAPAAPATVQEVPFHFQGPGLTVRVRCYCIGSNFDRSELQDMVLRRLPSSSLRHFPGDVLTSNYYARTSALDQSGHFAGVGDIIFFCQLGSVVFWGLHKDEERHVLREIAEPCLVDAALPRHRQERDRLRVLYTSAPLAAMKNDTLALHYRHAEDIDVKLACSSALAQSTQLRVYEEELRILVKRLATVPTSLAESGQVPLKDREVLRCIGELYSQMSSVNLIGAAMGMPEAVEGGRTAIRTLYRGVHEYLDIEERLQLLNERFSITNELLELCRTMGHQMRLERLDGVVILLLVVCVVVALFQLAGFVGWTPSWQKTDDLFSSA
jgi:uncharacterized Rmd1/YagE family protein